MIHRDSQADPSGFFFRGLHPGLFFGTMSDRYAGWIGQIYSRDRWAGRASRRDKRLGSQTFTEEVLPVASVEEYFEHFPALEIDFTFYRPLLERSGEPGPGYRVLQTYLRHLKPSDLLVLKVPQSVFARRLRSGDGFRLNPDYLDARAFTTRFYAPALKLLGDHLAGFIFEQEYQRAVNDGAAGVLAEELEAFFGDVPPDLRYHVEIRTVRLLREPLFRVLRRRRVGLVLSRWTWLPSLRQQIDLAGGWFDGGDGSRIIRLITPRGRTYQQTYAAAHPFSETVPGMLSDSVVEESVEIIRGVVREGSRLYLFVNNRAGGNAPLSAMRIAREFLARSS